MNDFDIESLRRWFLAEQRDLPWRGSPHPYAVWVSEVMLQQTQVAVVIPYFERWMQRFPTIQALAQASLDEVIKMWEGLGYYSRARNLHAGAKQVMNEFGGVLPSDEKELRTIKGLGPYTVGAIRAFAFKYKAAAVDGNVLRVLSRHDLIMEDISKPKTVKQMTQRTESILPDFEPWVISEALIELGATVCQRNPKCTDCPLKKNCLARSQGKASELPVKGTKVPVTILHRAVVVIVSGRSCLVRREDQGKVMSDLHQFPYYETVSGGLTIDELKEAIEQSWGINLQPASFSLDKVKHGFTRYTVNLYPSVFTCERPLKMENYQWRTFEELDQLAFSSGHRQIYQALKDKWLNLLRVSK